MIPKFIYLDHFPSFLELMKQKLQIQLSRLIMSFYLNEKLDSTLMKILNSSWDLQLQYVVSLFNTSYNTNITKFLKKKSYSIFTKKMRNNTNFLINYELLSNPSTLMFETKVQTIPKVQMEYFQDLIVDLNTTH